MAFRSLPLKSKTPARWAAQVLARPLELLSDHAFLERKAANNAFELLNRWPGGRPPSAKWLEALSSVARDEAAHLNAVVRHLAKRGGHLARMHQTMYVADLRRLVRLGEADRELVDRLLVSSLIEARSCERFKLLGQACADAELRKFYRSLWSAEFGHYRVFLQLALDVRPKREVMARWKEMLALEAEIAAKQPLGVGILSGWA